MYYIDHYNSPFGGITLASDGSALNGLWFDGQKYFGETLPPRGMQDGNNGKKERRKREAALHKQDSLQAEELCRGAMYVFGRTKEWLDAYFHGKIPGFMPPLALFEERETEEKTDADAAQYAAERDFSDMMLLGEKPPRFTRITPFRRAIWSVLLTIPYGETMSYGQIAREVAKRGSAEQVSAQAVGGAVGHNPVSIIVPCHRVISSDGSLTGYAAGIDVKWKLLALEGAKIF